MNIKQKESAKDSFFMQTTLGECIRMKRESLNMSLEELADKIFVSKSTLSKIETGKLKYPKAVYVFRLSKVLNLNYKLLLELQGYDIEYIGYRDRRDNYR